MRIDQLVPAFHRGDAIGDEAFELRGFLRGRGYDSEIYCLSRDRGLEGQARLFDKFPMPGSADITILHFALPSPLSPAFARLGSRKVLLYHNITPAEYFLPYSLEMAQLAYLGRKELASLVGATDLGLADSEFNRQDLIRLGFRRAEVFPLYVDFARYERPADRFIQDLVKDGRTNILFVGRIVPNKKIEDLIKVTFYYKKYISPLVRLLVVGKTQSLPKYYHSLTRLADEFYLKSEEVQFTGHIPDEEMYALYRASDVFLSLSEHEGFCLPLLESMAFDLPVAAYDAAAVPGTLAGAGVLIRDRRVDRVAELVDILSHDDRLREEIRRGQRRRLEEFKKTDWGRKLLDWLRA